MGNVQNFLILISQSQVSSDNWFLKCGPRLPINISVRFIFPSYYTLPAAFVITNISNILVRCLTGIAVPHGVYQSGVYKTAVFSDEKILVTKKNIYIYFRDFS